MTDAPSEFAKRSGNTNLYMSHIQGQGDGGQASKPVVASTSPFLTPSQKEELEGYVFQFTNFSVEGGGSKAFAAVGAIRVLEELGYWGNIKRFAGASAGSVVAAFGAVGYNSHDIEKFSSWDNKVFLDATFGKLSLLPNMLRKFGWHPGNKIYEWFGDRVQAKMGNRDLTFEELYQQTGRELCITVTNMNNMDCTYCHVKTTPDMPIRQAVRMSCSIPGVYCPVKVQKGKTNDYFVDGGLLCNYPIHCYDGWFLSMEKENSFLRRLKSIEELPKLWEPKERFGKRNDRTFGILLYAGNEREVMKQELMDRFDKFIKPSEKQEYPPTKLAKKRAEVMKEQAIKAKEHRLLVTTFFNLMKVLEENDIDESGTISEQEFEKAMNQTSSDFSDEDKKLLFGDDFRDTKALFKRMDTHADGEITFRELVSFAEKQGLEIMENFRGYKRQEITDLQSYFGAIMESLLLNMKRIFVQITFRELVSFAEKQGLEIMENFRGYKRQEITDLQSYFGAIMESLLLNMKRIFVQSSDVSRTIGIDTSYLDTLDFDMEKQDQDYLVQQGKLGCMAFLRELIAEGKITRKT
ncbi:uncharacterized protein LOC110984947 [Acanthaster planci]|uniref:Uncharacterized protein LOC110984947 n=1 Tax=Acanthaster planci TaxID=133434 RepID=A0A8B7Z8L5_ACAPL|nr:uncharacterized protein LOC110984947 [Acanthaster planci]